MTPETTPSDSGTDALAANALAAPAETGLGQAGPQMAATEMPFEIPTWEDDETLATAVYRSLFVVVAAGFLAYAQWRAPMNWSGSIGQNWGRWVWTSGVCNFLLPIGIIWMFFGQGLTYQDWLKDQKHNAWSYGWDFSKIKRHGKIALACWLFSLVVLIPLSRNPEMRAAYASYLPPATNLKEWAFLLSTLTFYMFCWEWFFRGFMLFGVAQGVGPVVAVALQAILFGLTHYGKPPVEMWSAFGGGLVLGTLAWREKSFVPAFLIHTLIHLTWAVLVLI